MTETTAKNARLLVPVFIGAAVSTALGVYGANHKGKSIVFEISGFPQISKTMLLPL